MSVTRNMVASLAANVLAAAVSAAIVPTYLRLVGVEAYGLLGVLGTFQATASLLDFGFTLTITRELAACAGHPSDSSRPQDLVRTLEAVYWVLAVFIGVAVISVAAPLAGGWLTGVNLSRETIRDAIVLIGFVLMLQWPFSFYAGGLIGLQKHVLLASVNGGMSVVRGLGALVILTSVSATVHAFLLWQLFISLSSTVLVAGLLWRYLPKAATRPAFDLARLKSAGRFSVRVAVVSSIGVVLLQTDKLLLSRLLNLAEYGYYTLACTVTAALYIVINPVYSAVFPRLTQLVAANEQAELIACYHKSAAMMAALICPAAAILAVFAHPIVLAWTGNHLTASKTASLTMTLAVGTGIYGLMHVPWAAQLAHGWTRLAFTVNSVALLIFVPLILALTYRYGGIGGATAWALLNVAYGAVIPVIMHRRILEGEWRRWLLSDTARPAAASVLTALAGRLLLNPEMSGPSFLSYLGLVSILTFVAAASSAPLVRRDLISRFVRHSSIVIARHPS